MGAVPDQRTTVDSYLSWWLSDVVAGTVRESTLDDYSWVTSNYLVPNVDESKTKAGDRVVPLTDQLVSEVVPVAGMAAGGVPDFGLVQRIAAAANDAYRERFLIERSGGLLSAVVEGVEEPAGLDDNVISVIELLEDGDALLSSDPGVTPTNEDSS